MFALPTWAVENRKRHSLTTPDMVLLSLLTERPTHGYEANAELERREIRDWAAISRPQVYYSIEKLLRLGLVRAVSPNEAQQGPDRHVVATTARGREALADALERTEWATQRERPPFLTWMALSWLARPGVIKEQLRRRRKFLEGEIARKRATLASVFAEVDHEFHEAVWMIKLMILQFETELAWTRQVESDLPRCARAKNPPLP
jgi:DNA-binding PadR family transcriptional regulator